MVNSPVFIQDFLCLFLVFHRAFELERFYVEEEDEDCDGDHDDDDGNLETAENEYGDFNNNDDDDSSEHV